MKQQTQKKVDVVVEKVRQETIPLLVAKLNNKDCNDLSLYNQWKAQGAGGEMANSGESPVSIAIDQSKATKYEEDYRREYENDRHLAHKMSLNRYIPKDSELLNGTATTTDTKISNPNMKSQEENTLAKDLVYEDISKVAYKHDKTKAGKKISLSLIHI